MRARAALPIGPAPALCLAAGLLLPWHVTEAGWWRAATWAAWPGEGAMPLLLALSGAMPWLLPVALLLVMTAGMATASCSARWPGTPSARPARCPEPKWTACARPSARR